MQPLALRHRRHPMPRMAPRMLADQQMPVDVVRMGSTVTYRPDNGDDREVTLVLPAEADISEGRISVLTPVGTALIGLRTGQSTTWTARNGRDHVLPA